MLGGAPDQKYSLIDFFQVREQVFPNVHWGKRPTEPYHKPLMLYLLVPPGSTMPANRLDNTGLIENGYLNYFRRKYGL